MKQGCQMQFWNKVAGFLMKQGWQIYMKKDIQMT